MTERQKAALEALRNAEATYRQADAHRCEMIGLARRVGVPLAAIERAIGLRRKQPR